jgi:hypothetical protein
MLGQWPSSTGARQLRCSALTSTSVSTCAEGDSREASGQRSPTGLDAGTETAEILSFGRRSSARRPTEVPRATSARRRSLEDPVAGPGARGSSATRGRLALVDRLDWRGAFHRVRRHDPPSAHTRTPSTPRPRRGRSGHGRHGVGDRRGNLTRATSSRRRGPTGASRPRFSR